MNLKCLICRDLFTPASEIYVTSCGHLFHYNCLMQWIERSQTCPQCRSKSTKNTIHKVYLNVEETADATTDTGIVDNILSMTDKLQVKLKNLQFQMNLRETNIKVEREKYEIAKKETIELREELKSQESKTRVVESEMHALEDQVQSKYKECDKLQDEVRKLKDRLKNMQHVETAITGSREHISDMLRHNRVQQKLALVVETELETLSRISTQISYDGLGKHAKDDQFPGPQQAHRKRSKSLLTATSAKFRKISHLLEGRKKLNNFFSDSQPDCSK